MGIGTGPFGLCLLGLNRCDDVKRADTYSWNRVRYPHWSRSRYGTYLSSYGALLPSAARDAPPPNT